MKGLRTLLNRTPRVVPRSPLLVRPVFYTTKSTPTLSGRDEHQRPENDEGKLIKEDSLVNPSHCKSNADPTADASVELEEKLKSLRIDIKDLNRRLVFDIMESLNRILVHSGTYVCSEDTQKLLENYRADPKNSFMEMMEEFTEEDLMWAGDELTDEFMEEVDKRYDLDLRLRTAALNVASDLETTGQSELTPKLPPRSARILLPTSRLYRAFLSHGWSEPYEWDEAWMTALSHDRLARFLENPGFYMSDQPREDIIPALTAWEQSDILSEFAELRNLDGTEMRRKA
ncbi:hypothetical protein IAT38_008315 [Cryptococcus sp. DSM 104549]